MRNKKNKNFVEYEAKIVGALIELISKDKICHPSVADLIKKADITRPTFYLHFKSVEEVYKVLEDRFVHKVVKYFMANFENSIVNLLDIELEFAKKIQKNISFYRNIAHSTHSGDFACSAAVAISNGCVEYFKKHPELFKSKPTDKWLWMYMYQLVAAHVSAYVAVLRGHIDLPLEYLAVRLADQVFKICGKFWMEQGWINEKHDYLTEYETRIGKKKK